MTNVRHLMRTVLTGFVIVSFLTVTSACYGPFNLTRNVYHWNSNIKGSGEVSEKWMKEIVFFGMIVIPVYMFSALLDAFIFNSIQFWTGDNPIKVTQGSDGHIQAVQLRDLTIQVAWTEDHRSATLTYRQQGQDIKTARIIEEGNGYRLIEAGGESLYVTERASDGGVNIVDGDCRLVDSVSFERLQQASNELARASS
jgi:Domain of unknown function (DUF3332)